MKNGNNHDKDKRKFDDFNLFSIIDREFVDILNVPEGKDKKSRLSTVIYILGAIIFILGAIEGFITAQLIATSSLSEMKLSGIALLTAFIAAMIFIGFGKVVEIIVDRNKK